MIVLATPVYNYHVSAATKNLIELTGSAWEDKLVGFLCAAGDIVIVQDADLEYDPADYPRLIEPILSNQADVVYGSRFLPGDEDPFELVPDKVGTGKIVALVVSHYATFSDLTGRYLNLEPIQFCLVTLIEENNVIV